MTQAQDLQARLSRLRWLSEEHGLVVGSEGGASYAAGTVHFVERQHIVAAVKRFAEAVADPRFDRVLEAGFAVRLSERPEQLGSVDLEIVGP